MKRFISVILTVLFTAGFVFGCAPNMPDKNPKYKGIPLDKMESQDTTGDSTDTGTTSPDKSTDTGTTSPDESTESENTSNEEGNE
ncbi:hypothetical protein KKB99_06945 [bacterium]|nr:hypothetical protein [bacterium]MBU1025727.1 hypothetical protein [bacterium]